MLLEFTCSNYKSIYKKAKLSMLASSDDTREEDLISYDKYRINRISAIYGPNGSGKTTVLEAIVRARDLIRSSMKTEPGDRIICERHKLSSDEEPTEFTFQYVTRGMRYAYGFSILNGKIDEEYLYYFPKKRQSKIFYRNGLNVENGDGFRKFSDASLESLKDNRLFLACAANYTSNQDIENAFLFFKTDLKSFWSSKYASSFISTAIKYLATHPELKNTYVQVLDYLNTGIKGVDVRFEKKSFSEDELPKDIPASLKKLFTGKDAVISEATIQYDRFSTDLETEESTGIQKLFAFLYLYIDTLLNGHVLICDEIETGLHESIVMGILKLFPQLYPQNNAQLIFTTHDTSLLDNELFRRDQIWFTELDDIRSTDLYSLAEIRNVRKTENLKNGYVSGKYGAIPMLNSKLFSQILDELSSVTQNTSYVSDMEE